MSAAVKDEPAMGIYGETFTGRKGDLFVLLPVCLASLRNAKTVLLEESWTNPGVWEQAEARNLHGESDFESTVGPFQN